jgi:hypothetical protein
MPAPKGTMGDWATIAREQNAERRARVLAHPDIAKRLTEHPLNYSAPEVWSGFIPPAEIGCCLRCGSRDKRNPSPQRRALVAICQAVIDRENQLDVSGDALGEVG